MGTLYFVKISLALSLLLGFTSYVSAYYYNDMVDFKSHNLQRCFNSSESNHLLINGQEYPLSQTFENFINLVEKFESANPQMHLKEMLYIFLKNFTYEGIITKPNFMINNPQNAEIKLLQDLWNERWKNFEENMPDHTNPFDDNESCSLFYMLSHTVNDSAVWYEEDSKVYTPVSQEGQARADIKKTKHPREQGTILVRPGSDRIALSRVLVGLFLGLDPQEIPMKEFLDKKKRSDFLYPDADKLVSPLHIMTLSDAILMTEWEQYVVKQPKGFGKDGEFYSIGNAVVGVPETSQICPTVYKLPENSTSLNTYALVRGATDGLILGSIVKGIAENSPDVRLSQILRPYYTDTKGFLAPPIGDLVTGTPPAFFSSCSRSELLNPLMEKIEEQTDILLGILSVEYTSEKNKAVTAWSNFEKEKTNIFNINEGYCRRDNKTPESKCETPADVIVVLDTGSSEEDRVLQQEIVGYLANNLDLYPGGGTMNVLSDQLNGTSYLKEIIPQTNSSAAVACYMAQNMIEQGTPDRIATIEAIDQLLQDRKKEDKELNGAPAKVVIYFNFNEEEKPNRRLNQVIGYLQRRHIDVPFIAVGRNQDVLKKYVGLNLFGISRLIGDSETEKLGQELARKVCLGPALLQYSDCKKAKDESNAIYESYVTQNAVQHWFMDAKYFEKSLTAKMFFDAVDGDIKVCHNRATARPEMVESNCHTTNSTTRRLPFSHTNPCQGFTAFTCASMYFSVIGVESKPTDQLNYCKDIQCSAVNQVKFKVSHEGVRCSGCSAILSSTSLVLISLFAYIFVKNN